MSTAVLTILRPIKTIKTKILVFPKIRIHWKMLCLVMSGLCGFLTIYYFYQVHFLVSSQEHIEKYQKEINQLTQEQSILELTLAENNFWGKLKESIKELNFQKPKTVKYIHVLDNSILTLKK